MKIDSPNGPIAHLHVAAFCVRVTVPATSKIIKRLFYLPKYLT